MTDPKKAAKKKKRDLIITGILLVLFAISFTKNVLLRNRRPTAPPPAAAAAASLSQDMASQLISVTRLRSHENIRTEQKKVWEKEWARDPFVPLATFAAVTKAVNLTLNGVLWDEKTPKAIINEKTLTVGEVLYGYTVVEIKPRSVVLRTGERNTELQIFRPVPTDAPSI